MDRLQHHSPFSLILASGGEEMVLISTKKRGPPGRRESEVLGKKTRQRENSCDRPIKSIGEGSVRTMRAISPRGPNHFGQRNQRRLC